MKRFLSALTFVVAAATALTACGDDSSSPETKVGNAPTITNVTTLNASGIYGIGETIEILVTFSEPVVATGTLELGLNVSGSNSEQRFATCAATSGSSSTLTCTYTVQKGDQSEQLAYNDEQSFTLSGGSIKNAKGVSANLTLPVVTTSGLYFAGIGLDGTPPWVNGATVLAADSITNQKFGNSVALSSAYLVAGAQSKSKVYVSSVSNFALTQALSHASTTDKFGHAVSISQNTIAIGAYADSCSIASFVDSNTNCQVAGMSKSGAVYVYVNDGSSWAKQAYLKSTTAAANELFGSDVAVDGDLLIVGNPGADANSVEDSGAAHVFKRNGTLWAEVQTLNAGVLAGSTDSFGSTVALSGTTAVVGAPFADTAGLDSGTIYVFASADAGQTWTSQVLTVPGDLAASDSFGSDVAIDSDTIVAGAPGKDSGAGAAYVYTRSAGIWYNAQKLSAPEVLRSNNDGFGLNVSIVGNTLVIGANLDDDTSQTITNGTNIVAHNSDTVADVGTLYVFTRRNSGASWALNAVLKAPNAANGDQLGDSISITATADGTSIAAGATFQGDSNTGAVYLFNR